MGESNCPETTKVWESLQSRGHVPFLKVYHTRSGICQCSVPVLGFYHTLFSTRNTCTNISNLQNMVQYTPGPLYLWVHYLWICTLVDFPPNPQKRLQIDSCGTTPNIHDLPADSLAIPKERMFYTVIKLHKIS